MGIAGGSCGGRALGVIGEAVVDAAIAGLVMGVVEAVVLAQRGGVRGGELPAFVAALVGLTLVPAIFVGTAIGLGVRMAARHPLIASAVGKLRRPGPTRIEMLAGLALAVAAIGLLWWSGFAVIAWSAERFRAARPAAMLATSIIAATAVILVALVALVAPRIARWCGRSAVLVRATTGKAAFVIGIGLVMLSAVVVDRTVIALAPAWDPVPAYVRTVAILVLLTAAMVRPARRVGRRNAAGAAAVSMVLAVLAPFVVARDPVTRGVVVSRGVVAGVALDVITAPFDGDGDGFVDVLGMVDCDDGRAAVHPGAVEIAGNGLDDDCGGGDADVAALIARRAARQSANPAAARHDIVLITIDSLRVDHASAYGYGRSTTPAMAALAARGVRFDHAITTAPSTRFALPALLFGRHAQTLPYSGGAWPLVGKHALPTLASTLSGAGYRTAAILSRDLPMSQPTFAGFDDVFTIQQQRPERNVNNADAVAARALEWLAVPGDRPRFLWIHLLDPHTPYQQPPGAPRFTGAHAAYDAEIAFADAAVGRIAGALDPARAIIVVTADHGEAFLDHHQRFHGTSLHEEEIHVPFVLAAPGVVARTIPATVSHLDLAPTLLELVGLTTPAGMTGLSLVPHLEGAPLPPRALLATALPNHLSDRSLVALYLDGAKLIRDHDAATTELYDLRTDPRERAPIRSGARLRALATQLDAAITADLARLP